MDADFILALNEIEREKGIPKSVIFDALKKALEKSYEKNFNDKANVIVEIDEESGKIDVFSLLDVVEDVHDPVTEILLDSARNMQAGVKVGDVIRKPVTPKDFGRISAQTARNIVIQKIKDAEREVVYNEFADREKEMITGTVQRYERNNVYINMGRTEGLLPLSEQVPGERVVANQRMKLFIQEVRNSPKGPQIVLSRANPGLVIRMFETEVPEISDGVVEIFSIAREAGSRTKIAVFSRDENVDPVGACVGFKGARVRAIVDELGGEKIDIIVWDKDIRTFIANALSPSKVTRVIVKEKEKTALVVVPDDQLSLAIGKEGQNARLAAKLTGRKIDIKGESFVTEEELAEDVPVSPTPSDFFDAIHELQTESTDETENEPWFDEVQAEDLQTDEDSVTAADDPIEENADNETQENPPA
ncbi:MAG: transcription termination/antitermination protein NusA [Tissierellia bacterium]|nr:transcription termination factor NusA [Bacillota bacterium]NLK59260.1 transcription termination/antitermination protein NusA [Tissierellia bacterium]